MKNSLISIIVPVYKAEKYLNKCINSILNQTYKSFELILVDDGSPDSCGKICDEYASKDNRVKVIHTENSGPMSARKIGVKNAVGEYVGFVDSDDWIDTKMYEVMYSKAKETNADIVAIGYIYKKDAGEEKHGTQQDYLYDDANTIKNKFIPSYLTNHIEKTNKIIYDNSFWSKLYRRQIFNDNMEYVNDKVNYGEDMLLNYIILIDAEIIAIIGNSYFYHYRCNPSSIMQTYKKNLWNEIKERVALVLTVSGEKQYYCKEIDIHLGWLVYTTLKYYLHSPESYKEKYNIISNIMRENPAPRQFDMYAEYLVGFADKIYIRLIKLKMYRTVIFFMYLYDKIYKRKKM